MVSASGPRANVATLLHLSDLHFGAPEGKGHFWNSEGLDPKVPEHDQRKLLDCLVQDLERQPTPDIVVVSGDLLDKGNAAGVPLVQAFLAELADRLKLPRTQFVLVPGNHDVNLRASGAEMYEYFDSIWKAFYGDERPSLDGKAAHERPEVFDYPELGLQVVGFNSCEVLEKGREEGYVGDAQRRGAEQAMHAIQGPRFRVAVMHHHRQTPEATRGRDVSIMVDPEGVRRWLIDHRFSLALHGHQHLDWQRPARARARARAGRMAARRRGRGESRCG